MTESVGKSSPGISLPKVLSGMQGLRMTRILSRVLERKMSGTGRPGSTSVNSRLSPAGSSLCPAAGLDGAFEHGELFGRLLG